MAAPPAPEAPKDLDTASQLYYSGYPSVYSAGVYPTAYSSYAYGGYPYATYGAYRPVVYGR
jgi:hypothetical protein